MGFGICSECGGYWCSVGGYVNYCVCKPPPAALTSDQVRANVARHDAERAVRAAAGLCRNCGHRAAPWSLETLAAGWCTYSDDSYSCGEPLFDDCEDRRLPAPSAERLTSGDKTRG